MSDRPAPEPTHHTGLPMDGSLGRVVAIAGPLATVVLVVALAKVLG